MPTNPMRGYSVDLPDRTDDRIRVRLKTGATGACSTCGYQPVAFGAAICPQCGARNPNPGVASRYAGPGMLIGFAAGGLVGAAGGALAGGTSKAIGAAFAMALCGMVAGLLIGLFGALVARLCGTR